MSYTPSWSQACSCDGHRWLGTCPCLRSTEPEVGLAWKMNSREKSCGEADRYTHSRTLQPEQVLARGKLLRTHHGQKSLFLVFLPPQNSVLYFLSSFKTWPSSPGSGSCQGSCPYLQTVFCLWQEAAYSCHRRSLFRCDFLSSLGYILIPFRSPCTPPKLSFSVWFSPQDQDLYDPHSLGVFPGGTTASRGLGMKDLHLNTIPDTRKLFYFG